MLYLIEIQQKLPADIQSSFWRHVRSSKQARIFTQKLVDNTCSQQKKIDALISGYLINWKFNRLAVIVKQILRLAICEILVLKESPPEVIINEAIELTRIYMDEESTKFVNGVLDECLKSQPDSTLTNTKHEG